MEHQAGGAYFASEADLLNVVIFGTTAKNWKIGNPDKKGNLRDFATVTELRVLANMETINATLIEQGFTKEERLLILSKRTEREFAILEEVKQIGEQKKLKLHGLIACASPIFYQKSQLKKSTDW